MSGKKDFFSPKNVANRQKSKGLQKLRWYCELCQKQVRVREPADCASVCLLHTLLQPRVCLGTNPPSRSWRPRRGFGRAPHAQCRDENGFKCHCDSEGHQRCGHLRVARA